VLWFDGGIFLVLFVGLTLAGLEDGASLGDEDLASFFGEDGRGVGFR
jgi:hypothetical protein